MEEKEKKETKEKAEALVEAATLAVVSAKARRDSKAAQAEGIRAQVGFATLTCPFETAVVAGVLLVTGDEANAIQELEMAARGFERLGMAAHAASARHHLAHVRRDERQLAQQVDALQNCGISRPRRFARALIPGLA